MLSFTRSPLVAATQYDVIGLDHDGTEIVIDSYCSLSVASDHALAVVASGEYPAVVVAISTIEVAVGDVELVKQSLRFTWN